MGFVDIVGGFHLPCKQHHVDQLDEAAAALARKKNAAEKLKEYKEKYIASLSTNV